MRSLLLLVTAFTAVSCVAFADETTKTDRKGDARGGPFDLKSASVAHAGRDVFRHRVTGWSAGGVGPLRLEVATGGGSRPAYFVAKFEGKAGVYEFTRRGSKRVGPAKLTRHSSRSYSFTFSLEPMGLPDKYRWRWVVVTPDNPGGADRLPNRGFVTHGVDTGHD
jgi:hypothetical protein